MKFNIIRTLIALGISSLVGYGLYENYTGANQILLVIGTIASLSIVGVLAVGVDFELPRTSTNIKVISGVFFLIILSVNIGFSYFQFSKVSYILSLGILMLIYGLLINSIHEAKQ